MQPCVLFSPGEKLLSVLLGLVEFSLSRVVLGSLFGVPSTQLQEENTAVL